MVTVLRPIGLFDEVIILDQIGKPIVGLAAKKAVKSIKTLLKRPFCPARTGSHILLRHIVVLADPEGAVAVIPKDIGNRRHLIRQTPVGTGKAIGCLSD